MIFYIDIYFLQRARYDDAVIRYISVIPFESVLKFKLPQFVTLILVNVCVLLTSG